MQILEYILANADFDMNDRMFRSMRRSHKTHSLHHIETRFKPTIQHIVQNPHGDDDRLTVHFNVSAIHRIRMPPIHRNPDSHTDDSVGNSKYDSPLQKPIHT